MERYITPQDMRWARMTQRLSAQAIKHPDGVVSKLIRADTPNYRQLLWTPMPNVDPKLITWHEAPGDPKAKRFPYGWYTTLRMKENIPGALPREAAAKKAAIAVAYLVGSRERGIVVVGTLPDDLQEIAQDTKKPLTVALRRGRNPVLGTIGMVHDNDFEQFYPGAVSRVPGLQMIAPNEPRQAHSIVV